MCALQATGTDWICFCRSSFLLLHDMFLHFSIYPTFVPFETAIVSSKIRKGNTPIIIYRRKHYKKKNISVRVCGGHPENPLQQARLKAGVSQDQIAEHLSCDIRTIQWYEAGVQFPDWNELLKMKVRYSCEFADLFPEEFR